MSGSNSRLDVYALSSMVQSATRNAWRSLHISQRKCMVLVRGIFFNSSAVALKFERNIRPVVGHRKLRAPKLPPFKSRDHRQNILYFFSARVIALWGNITVVCPPLG